MADNDLGNHELMRELDNAPAPNPPTVAEDQPEAKVPDRDESGRFARKSEDEAPEAPEDLEASAEDADDTADEGESDDERESDDEQEAKPQRRRTARDRISELTARSKAAEARAFAAEQRLRELQEQASKPVDPNLEFEDPAAYTQHAVRQALAEQETAQRRAEIQQAAQETYQAAVDTFYSRLEDFRDEMPDFDEVWNDDVPISREAVPILARSEIGPKIAYHLAKNPRQARDIAKMSPADQAYELGRLEARLSTPPPKRTTKAPKPARPISANGTAGTFDPSSSSVDDFKKQIFG